MINLGYVALGLGLGRHGLFESDEERAPVLFQSYASMT
jgi:hypothetical protein